MEVIDNFTRDVTMECGNSDDVITMSIDEDHVIIRIVEPCNSLKNNASSSKSYAFTANFNAASVSKLNSAYLLSKPLLLS